MINIKKEYMKKENPLDDEKISEILKLEYSIIQDVMSNYGCTLPVEESASEDSEKKYDEHDLLLEQMMMKGANVIGDIPPRGALLAHNIIHSLDPKHADKDNLTSFEDLPVNKIIIRHPNPKLEDLKELNLEY